MVTVKIPNRFLHQLWLKKQAKHLFHIEDRLKTTVVGGKNPGNISPVKHVMSEEEQQRQTAAAEDLLSMNGQSQIYTATEDTLFTQTAPVLSKTHSLSLEWVFGMNPALPALCQQDADQLVILYAGAHFGVIYNHTLNSQYMLQGHCHSISCMCVSRDRRWIATADQGPKCMVVMWDSYSGIPVQTLFNCHPAGGVTAMAFSSDTQQLVTLGAEEIQRVCIWKWMDEAEKPLWCTDLDPKHGFQVNIIFDPSDNTRLLSSSDTHVLFYNTVLKHHQVFALAHKKLCKSAPRGCDTAPDLSEIVNLAAGSLSTSVFHYKLPLILTATAAGSLLIWDVSTYLTATEKHPKVKCKILPLQNAPITCLAATDSYFVTGDTEGHIKFYDEEFKLLIRYTEFSLDTIVFISFSKECTERPLDSCGLRAEPRIVRNFVVTTVSAIVHVKALESKTEMLLQKECEPLRAVDCHPEQSTVAMGNGNGVLKVWDYNSKTIVCSRTFENSDIRCIAFDSQGQNLAVGFESGAVHILDPQTLESGPDDCFHYSKDRIHLLAFSSDSNYLATADAGNAVTVFRLQADEESLHHWTYVGRYRSHYKPIRDLLFGVHPKSGQPRLLSLGMDRQLVEYDLKKSTVDNLLILSSVRIEQTAVPMCMAWYPPLTAEQFLLTASDQYKMKLFDSTSMMCRKTILGPRYGSPVEKVLVLPMSADTNKYYLAFITEDKLGLQILPLDGNPFKSNALICHPSGTSTLTCSYDGRFVFTSGRFDCTVLSWELNLNALEAAAALGGDGMLPFYTMLEGGKDGAFSKMEQLFFYCQIHSQGIDTMEKRQISTKIPLSEVSSLMQALAYFPTHKEVKDIENEIRFSKFAETGKYVTNIDLEEFIKLYINHRPAFGICDEFMQAFHVLGIHDSTGQLALKKEELLKMLKNRGEAMTNKEVRQCFASLLVLDGKEEGEKPGRQSEYSLELKMPEWIPMEAFACGLPGLPSSAELNRSPTSQE